MGSATAFSRLRQAAPTISVGMLTANLNALGTDIDLLHESGVQVVHFDIMDGVFCPMMTVGPPIVRAVQTPLLKDVHLMVEEPLDKVEAYVKAGADIITVHVESSRYVQQALRKLGGMTNQNDANRGIVRGIALNPGTPVDAIDPLMEEIEMILLLAVNPGFSGQGFGAPTPARRRGCSLRRVSRLPGEHTLRRCPQ